MFNPWYRLVNWYYLKVRKVPGADADAQEVRIYELLEELVARKMTAQLMEQAIKYDIDLQDYPETRLRDERGCLPAKARSTIRKLVDQEKERRFNVKTLWVTKFWVPLLAALVGIIGAITGLIAVLHHGK
jgi:hypothetical protein